MWNRCHHKNSIDKTLHICAMAYARQDNDIRKGGLSKILQGIIVDEMPGEGSALDELKYPCPNMDEYDISEYRSYKELALQAGDLKMSTSRSCLQRTRREI